MTGSTPTQLPPEIESVVYGLQQMRLSTFSPESLAWLALPPAWTEQLAQTCDFATMGKLELEEFLHAAVNAKLCIRDPESDAGELRAEATRTIAALWPHMQPVHRTEYRNFLISSALLMPDREEGLTLLCTTAALDDGKEVNLDLFRSQIDELPDPDAHARVLIQAALHFPSFGFLEQAWQATTTAFSPAKRSAARMGLLEHAGRHRVELYASVVEEVRSLSDPAARAAVLLKLCEMKTDGVSICSEAAATIEQITDPGSRALYLSLLAKADGNQDYALRAFEAASSIPDTAVRSRILSTIAVNCGERICAEALNLAWSSALNVFDSSERSALLVLAASQLALVEPDRALARADELSPIEIRAEVMLACLSSPANRNTRVADAIARVIDEIPLENMRARLLVRLAAFAVPSSLRLLDLANRLGDDAERRAALISIFPSLSVEGRFSVANEVLDDLRRVGDRVAVRTALVQLAPYLDKRQLLSALAIAANTKPERGFRADEDRRGEILQYLQRSKGQLFLYDTAYTIGHAIQKVRSMAVPTATARWVKLAAELRDPNVTVIHRLAASAGIADLPPNSGAGSFLTRQVREFVDAGDTGSALGWLRAGQLLIPVVGGEIEAAVLTGRHRVELSYRRSMDERHLRRYLERAEQTLEFQKLITGPDSHWALHYLGVGGVGKTMLLRHITARLAVKDGQRLAISTVDFDHISPEFPVRKPGQILAELADELRIYGGSSSIEGKFAEFQDRLLALHAVLSVQPPPEDPLKNVRSEAFQEVIGSFADLLRLLPPPVVLILDTCEELSKLEPVKATLPSVEAMFLILEKLHEQIPSIRILLAGRRLLAQSGDSDANRPPRWRAGECEVGERNCYLPEHKPYLRMHVIRGFTHDESARFLDLVADVHPSKEQRAAILDRSAEISEPIGISWSEPPAEPSGQRFNPFDLALYAEWLRESPNVSHETIRSGKTEPYVEMRIVRRMENDLSRNALPAAVLLRRFDSEMLRAIVPDGSERAEVFRDLQGHEWTDSQRDEDSSIWFLEVSSNLRKRIESYFSMPPREQELDRVRLLLGPDLDRQVRARLEQPQWFNRLAFSLVEPALRLQAPEPAALLWNAIDQRITETAEWNWALRVCPGLLGEDNAAGTLHSPLRAAIRATLNAALLHLQRDFQPAEAWREVAQCTAFHPILAIKQWLAYRAETFAAEDIQALRSAALQLRNPLEWSSDRYEQACVGLLARVYETGSRIEDPENWPDFGPQSAPELRPLRLLALKRAPIYELDLPQPLQRWADWRIPDCLTDRVRLEMVLTHLTEDVARRYATEWAVAAATRLNNIDSERLLSALLAGDYLNNAEPALLARISNGNYYDPARTASCRAHAITSPLYYCLAMEWHRRGETARARLILDKVQSEMLESRRSDGIDKLRHLMEIISERPRQNAELRSFELAAAYRSPSLISTILSASWGLALLAITTYAIFRLLGWVGPRQRFILIGAAFAAFLYLSMRYRDMAKRTFFTNMRPRIVLSEAGDRVRIARVNAATRFFNSGTMYEVEVLRPGSGPYSYEALKLAELSHQLRAWRFALGWRMPFELLVTAEVQPVTSDSTLAPLDLQCVAWEALIHFGIASTMGGKLRERLQIARTAPLGDVDTGWQAGERIALLARSSQMAALERAWTARASIAEFDRIDERSAGSWFSDRPVRAIHIVGRTRRSGSQRTFQVDAERHFTPDQIMQSCARIVIVQSQPVESLERTDTDREQMSALRAFAADLFMAGAHTVILLPQFPAATSEAVIRKLAAFCTKNRRPSYFALLNHVTDIRNCIAKSISADSASLTEARQKYTYAESLAKTDSATVDPESLKTASSEMSMDVTVWTRLA